MIVDNNQKQPSKVSISEPSSSHMPWLSSLSNHDYLSSQPNKIPIYSKLKPEVARNKIGDNNNNLTSDNNVHNDGNYDVITNMSEMIGKKMQVDEEEDELSIVYEEINVRYDYVFGNRVARIVNKSMTQDKPMEIEDSDDVLGDKRKSWQDELEENWNDNNNKMSSQTHIKSCVNCGEENNEEVDVKKHENEVDDDYFSTYNIPYVHKMMINDKSRTNAYRNAIIYNKHLFKDKIVLDVGCGTGILSMFAAKAGAKKVIAVDASCIADCAKQIIIDNHFQDKIIVIKTKVEDLLEKMPGLGSVDIIISEWMGHSLVKESMLASVIYARDNLMTFDGMIFPDIARLYICAIGDCKIKDCSKYRAKFRSEKEETNYKHVNLNLKSLKRASNWYERMRASVEYICCHQIISDSQLVEQINLNNILLRELKCIRSTLTLTISRDATLTGLATYFDVKFNHCHTKTVLSTSPKSPATHWAQTVMRVDPIVIQRNEIMKGSIEMTPLETNFRQLQIQVIIDKLICLNEQRGDKRWSEEDINRRIHKKSYRFMLF